MSIRVILSACVLGLIALLANTTHGALVGYWNYENNGNLGQDTSGQGNNLNNIDAPTQATGGGVFGSAVELDGNDAFIHPTFPVNVPTGGSSYSTVTWLNSDIANGGGMVGWGNYTPTAQANAFRQASSTSTKLFNYWFNSDLLAGDADDLVAGTNPAGWVHAVATYNAATNQHIIYSNGIAVGARKATPPSVAAANFTVGKTFNTEFFDGRLDDTAVYNNTIAANQIVALANKSAQPNSLPVASTSPLVALYRFENNGNLGLDSSNVKNNLTSYGNQVAQGTAKYGAGSLQLGGSDDFLGVANDNLGDNAGTPPGIPLLNGSYAISAWVRPDADTNINGGFVGWGNYGTADQANAFRMSGSNGINNYWWGAQDMVLTGLSTNFLDGQFHHVLAQYDANTNVREIYVDGILVGTGTQTAGSHNTMAENFRIGVTNTLAEDFKGLMDDVAIFDRALTFSERQAVIAGNFSAFVAETAPEPSSLVMIGLVGLGYMAKRRKARRA